MNILQHCAARLKLVILRVCARDMHLQLVWAGKVARDCVGELGSMLKVLDYVRGSLSGDSVTLH